MSSKTNHLPLSPAAIMASQADLDRWRAFGGTIEEKTRGKRLEKFFIAPDGAWWCSVAMGSICAPARRALRAPFR